MKSCNKHNNLQKRYLMKYGVLSTPKPSLDNQTQLNDDKIKSQLFSFQRENNSSQIFGHP